MSEGGPAFPTNIWTGMSLRDYFAAAALQAMDIQNSVATPAAGNMARSAYVIADEMLKARLGMNSGPTS